MKKKPAKKKYRVFIEQVNRTYVEVEATSEDEARTKAYRKWRRDYAHSRIAAVES